MLCPKCQKDNSPESHRCAHCGGSLSVALLEVVRGNLAEKVHFLKPRSYTLGRARHNDLSLNEPSISKVHARIAYDQGRFFIEDQGSLHGVYVNAAKAERAELPPGAQIQLGNVTLKFSMLGTDSSTAQVAEFPWIEQQQLLLSLVQTLNSTLVLSQVLEQVLDAVMRITRAERGFLLLADGAPEGIPYESVRASPSRGTQARRPRAPRRGPGHLDLGDPQGPGHGRDRGHRQRHRRPRARHRAQHRLHGPAHHRVHSPALAPFRELHGGPPRALGALYVDNSETSAAFSPESLRAAEALARHAALAIENAQLFEREQKTIEELRQAQKRLLQSEKLAAIGQMAAGIAHELNTPLTYIMGNLELLEAQSLTPAQRDMLTSISRGSERIKGLAQSLLAFSRPAQEDLVPLR